MLRLTAARASFDRVLLYLDGPQLVVLSIGPKSKIVAVATDRVADKAFFGAKVSLGQLGEYLDQRFDLRYLLLRPDRDAWYEFDLPEAQGAPVVLEEVPLTQKRIDTLLPDHGFFARDHSEEYELVTFEEKAVQRFEVDGNWDMREFSKFHAQISDLYALTRSIDLFVDEDTSLDQRRAVMKSFVKPWEGGGSYFGFFRSLAKAGGRDYRPNIKAIQWASPGYIDVFGERDSFDRLLVLVQHFGKSRSKILEDYEHLWSYLQETKYLNGSSKNLDRKSAIAIEIGKRAQVLSKALNVTSYRNLKMMAGNDPVVAAKVLLATKRRVQRLHDFFLEGRVSVEGQAIN